MVGNVQSRIKTKAFCVTSIDNKGEKHNIYAYRIDEISSDIAAIKVDSIVHHFNKNAGVSKDYLKRPTGQNRSFDWPKVHQNFSCES